MRSPINSTKHFTHKSLTTISTSAIENIKVCEAVVAPDANLANEVREGSLVKAVYVEVWAIGGTDSATPTHVSTVEKVPSGATPMTNVQSTNLFSYPNKKNILKTRQGLVPKTGQNPVNVFGEWIEIPKGKQRMGLGDAIYVNVTAISNALEICGIMVFKEYF